MFGVLYLVNRKRVEKGVTEAKAEPAAPVAAIKRDMTLAELKPFNGETNEIVLVALKGTIFDVSSSGTWLVKRRVLPKAIGLRSVRWPRCFNQPCQDGA